MSNFYPPWWDSTVTIYNRYEDPQTNVVTWFRSTVTGCFWDYSHDRVTINETVLETNNVICRIPVQDNFLERHEWEGIPNDLMGDYFTLSAGDIIIKGDVEDSIDEYQKGHRATDVIKKYKSLQGCLQAEVVSINVGTGRGSEHYLVRGI